MLGILFCLKDGDLILEFFDRRLQILNGVQYVNGQSRHAYFFATR